MYSLFFEGSTIGRKTLKTSDQLKLAEPSINCGKSWRPATFYSENFLLAFTMILRKIEPKFYELPEGALRKVCILLFLQRFAGFYGLADIEQVSIDPINPEYRVCSASLLSEAVEWNL